MQRRLKTIAALASGLVLAAYTSSASAALIQLTQERALTANASAGVGGAPVTDNKSEASAALGSFDRSFTSHAQVGQPPGIGWAIGDAAASHALQVGPTSIAGTLAVDAHARHVGGTVAAEADSDWSTTFRVDQPMPFDLTGRLRMDVSSVDHPGDFSLGLLFQRRADGSGSSELLYGFAINGPGGLGARYDQPVNVSGTLEPGYVYTLITGLSGDTSPVSGPGADRHAFGDITFNLTAVPEPSAAAVLALGATLVLRRRRV